MVFLSLNAIDCGRAPKSINSSEMVEVNGINQFVNIRGNDDTAPVLLMVHGGPGFSDMPFALNGYYSKLEEHFVVVNWDQRGTGKSFSTSIPEETMNIDQFVSDGAELAKLLCSRFKKGKIFLRGHSFGGLLGMLIAVEHPELFHAYFALDPAISVSKSIPVSHKFVYDRAKAENNSEAIKELDTIGIPPYKDLMQGMQILNKWLNVYGGIVFGGMENAGRLFALFGSVPGYTETDYKKAADGAAFSARTMAGAMDIDLFETVKEITIPVFFGVGRRDYLNSYSVTEEYYKFLKAPEKDLTWFERSAHFPNFSEPDNFQKVIVNKLLRKNIS
ncbi:MAG: alpha/beta hydrolase [bacterium]|nr:alpha/beta hydrolase [bacterium]